MLIQRKRKRKGCNVGRKGKGGEEEEKEKNLKMREKKRRKVGLGQSLAAKHWMRIYSAALRLLVRVRLNYARSSPETSIWHQPLQFADLFLLFPLYL